MNRTEPACAARGIGRAQFDARAQAAQGRARALVVELDESASEALLDALWAHATQPALLWTHDWLAGDTLIWDNRCLLHMALNDYDGSRRLLHRTTVAGERPVGP